MIDFPPSEQNTVAQTMDEGVTRPLKAHYRKRIVRVILTHLNQDKPTHIISLLKAMHLLVSGWNDFSKETVIDCFWKTNISEKDQMNKVNDVVDPFKELNESLNELQTKDWSVLPESMTVQDIAEVDDQVITMAPFLTNELILEEVSAVDKKDENNDFANDSDDNEEVKAPSSNEVEDFLFLFSKNRGRQIMDIIFNFENWVIVETFKNHKQPTIDDFFSKNWKKQYDKNII